MASKNEIYLYGSVGMSWWGEDYFTAKTVRDALAGMTGPVTVRINSGGGIAMEGQAIYTILTDYPDQVDVVVDGVAASAASLIAMAGETITMRLGSYLLVHDAALGWTDGRGTEEDHRRAADQLEVVSNALADIYAQRAGIMREEARAIMKAETFMDGPAAVDAGFATHYDADSAAAAAATFDYRIYAHAPAALQAAAKDLGQKMPKEAVLAMMAGQPRPVQPQAKEGVPMAKETATSQAVVGVTQTTEPAPQITAAATAPAAEQNPAPTAPVATVDGVQTERARASVITNAVAMAGLGVGIAQDLIARGVSEAVALAEITTKWKDKGDMDIAAHGRSSATITADARDKFKEGAALALMARAGLPGGERNEFTSLTLSEMARAALEQAGERIGMTSRHEYIGRAFTMAAGQHTTSDFVQILGNVANKSMLLGYENAEETFDSFTRTISVPDFKAVSLVGLDMFPTLRKVGESAEYKSVTVAENKESMVLGKYGELFTISREAIINDDLDLFGRLPQMMGRAARATVGNLVYSVLIDNPTMADGTALFHADHDNLAGTGAALSVASIAAARAAMRKQKSGKKTDTNRQVLNIIPRYLIVPAALEVTARQLIASEVDPTANKGMAINPIRNSLDVIVDARLDDSSATAWYLAAAPNQFDTIGVGYLDGNESPYLEQQQGLSQDGVTYKVRMEAVAAATGYKALYKNAGA